MISSSVVFLSLLLPTLAAQTFVVHESRDAAPQAFVRTGAASLDEKVNLRIGLASRNISGLEAMLYAVSTPFSPLYGQHLSAAEIKTYLSPTEEASNAVDTWLSSNNISASASSHSGDWLSLALSVEQANALLNTTFEYYTHSGSGQQVIRTMSYSLPNDLREHVDVVHPTISFSGALAKRHTTVHSSSITSDISKRGSRSSCPSDAPLTPACLQELYGIPATSASNSGIHIGVPGYADFWAQKADLSAFLERYRPDIDPNTTFSLQSVNGGTNPQGDGLGATEANLDVQYTIGIATSIPVTFISAGGPKTLDDFVTDLIDVNSAMLADDNRPQVMTTSYGLNEDIPSYAMAKKVCDGIMALGAAGVSFIAGSGDAGVAGAIPSNDTCSVFIPEFLSTCPFTTSVGGTTSIPETAANFTGGGFSNYWARPSYQDQPVSKYLSALGSTYSGLFNATGRAYPDVATSAIVEIVDNSVFQSIWGTSCSSPIFASIIALINDRLVQAGKPVLGFLNPFLYANPDAFTDITTGSNPGCNTSGFPATAGWDPVTGLGTPKFGALLSAAGL